MENLDRSPTTWTPQEEKFLRSFRHPAEIQRFLNTIPYNDHSNWKSPRYVLKEKTANCGEGACLAAAIFKQMGYDPLVLDMAVVDDDDHLIAVYKHNNHWGAVGKSNTTLLKFREPVFRNVRELVMSYFEFYFNLKGLKSLRKYSLPINLDQLVPADWMTTDADLNGYEFQFLNLPYETILTKEMIQNLSYAESDVIKACFLGASLTGLYIPKECNIEKIEDSH